ncbi:MAG: 3-keto-disaccharide hydrolase [Planctomycetota bacterium]|jgi:hypothetical protein
MSNFSRMLLRFMQVVLVFGAAVSLHAGEQAKWKALFDGKTLDGWEVKSGFAKYHVEDDMIVGTTVKGSSNTFLCTRKQYGDFILEFEVKVDPALNSGVQIRSHVYEKETKIWMWRDGKKREKVHQADRVHGYQVEIDPSERAWSGGIYDEARRGWLNDLKDNAAGRKAFKSGQWNKFRVVCIGDSIKTWINEVPCADLRDPVDQTGFISLQVHGFKGDKPAQVRWRGIRIKELGRHVWKPLFNSKSLAGWHTLPGGKWEVRDGVIEGSNTSSDKRHGLLVSDKRYKNFTVRLKFKTLKGNSGFYFRVDEIGGGVGVHGFQAEIDESKGVGGLYETGGRGWVVQPSEEDVAKWFKPGQWNQMTVSAHGRRIVVFVNGLKSAELRKDKGRLKGHLALQLHGSQDVHVMFKDIEILLPRK